MGLAQETHQIKNINTKIIDFIRKSYGNYLPSRTYCFQIADMKITHLGDTDRISCYSSNIREFDIIYNGKDTIDIFRTFPVTEFYQIKLTMDKGEQRCTLKALKSESKIMEDPVKLAIEVSKIPKRILEGIKDYGDFKSILE